MVLASDEHGAGGAGVTAVLHIHDQDRGRPFLQPCVTVASE